MELSTKVGIPKYPFTLNHSSATLFMGSCFAENVGAKLTEYKFPTLVNPFGVQYNPVSVGQALQRIVSGLPLTEKELSFANGLWYSYQHHSSLSAVSKEECLANINQQIETAHSWLRSAKTLFVTFGTARVYYLKSTGNAVANCHKQPAKLFDNKLLTVNQIIDTWSSLIAVLQEVNPLLKIVFTVSPVRHWKDGAVGNQVSKSTLHVAINSLVEQHTGSAYYFPSYEIMMDELRDYRYYATDMLHPSPLAVDYIWERLVEAMVDKKSVDIMKSVERINLAVKHRPFNAHTTEHQTFIKKTLGQIAELEKQLPNISFSQERSKLEQQVLL